MYVYHVFTEDTEITGNALLDFTNAIQISDESVASFKKHKLVNIDPSKWYPYQSFLDALNEIIAANQSVMDDLVSIGMKQAEKAIIPDAYLALPIMEILKGMNAAYAMNLRGTDIGEIKTEVLEPTLAKLTLRVPAPDDLWYGVTYGYMKRLTAGKKVPFTIKYDPKSTRRDLGGKDTVILVSWK